MAKTQIRRQKMQIDERHATTNYKEGKKMKIRDAYKIQAAYINEIGNIRPDNYNFFQGRAESAQRALHQFGHIAALLGWDHEIDSDADEDSDSIARIKSLVPDYHAGLDLAAAYEAMGNVVENNIGTNGEY